MLKIITLSFKHFKHSRTMCLVMLYHNDTQFQQSKYFLNMHPLITANTLQKKVTSSTYTINCSLHWELKIKITTEETGTIGPMEILVTYKAHIIQNITGLPEEVQFVCISLAFSG